MAKIAEVFVEIGAKQDKLRRGFRQAISGAERAAARMSAAFARVSIGGALAVGAGLLFSAKAFIKQQEAVERLRSTLQAYGDDVARSLPLLKRQASAIQALTGVGDEHLLQLMATLRAQGVLPDELGDATKAVLGLAHAFNIGEESALRMLAAAKTGNFELAGRYVRNLEGLSSAQEKFNALMEAARRGFESAAEQSKTLGGSIRLLKASMGDLAESIGEVFFGSKGLSGAIRHVAGFVGNFATGLSAAAQSIRDIFGATWDLIISDVASLILRLKIQFVELKEFLANAGITIFGADFDGMRRQREFLEQMHRLQGQQSGEFLKRMDEALKRIREAFNLGGDFDFGKFGFRGAEDQQRRGIVNTIDTVTGAFKFGQKSRDIEEDQLDEAEEQTQVQKQILGVLRSIEQNGGLAGAFT